MGKKEKGEILIKGLNIFLVSVNLLTFCFSPFKIFFKLLVPTKFSIATFGPYFKVYFFIFLMKLYRNV